MAIHRLINPGAGESGVIVVDGPNVRVVKPTSFESPKAAAFLADIPDEHRLGAVEELLDHGAAAASAAQSSAHIVMLESKVDQLTTKFGHNLGDQLKNAGTRSAEITQRLLDAHKQELAKLVTPLTDANAKDGLPTKMAELLDQANRNALQRIAVMLQDGEEGALAKAVKQITEQVKETGLSLTKQLAGREALLTKSNLRGGRFEDVLAARLPILARGMGRVEHCATSPGEKAGNAGDYLITLASTRAEEPLTLAIEAKSHKGRFSPNEIKRETKAARLNRGAAAAILITDSADILPDGLGFGQVSDSDFYVALDPEQCDETPLTCALYFAKVAALATVSHEKPDQIDLNAALREVSVMRGLLEQFSKIEGGHSKIDKELTNVRTYAGDVRSDLLATLRRLDAILNA